MGSFASMSSKPAVGFVLACVFLDAFGIGLIIPVLPRLIGVLAGSADAQTLWYGAIMVSYGLMQFLAAPMVGAISDHIGRRPVLLAGIFGLSIMMLTPAISSSLWLILASRLLGGVMSSNIVVAQAYIADVTPAGKRTAAFGRIGAIFGIAFILGPALGGLLGERDPRLPFLAASLICAINFLYGLFVLPESLATRKTRPIRLRQLNPFAAISALGREKLALPVLLVMTLYTLSQSLMQCTWALYTQFRYDWNPADIGLSIFALGLSITVVQGLVLPFAAKRLKPRKLVLWGLSLGTASYVGMALSTNGLIAAVFICTVSLMGMIGPTLQSVVSTTGSPSTQGIRLGAMSAVNSFTGAISPVIGTPLLLLTSKFSPTSLAAGMPYWLCAVIASLGIALTLHFPLPQDPCARD